jgi:hypothetical protein
VGGVKPCAFNALVELVNLSDAIDMDFFCCSPRAKFHRKKAKKKSQYFFTTPTRVIHHTRICEFSEHKKKAGFNTEICL